MAVTFLVTLPLEQAIVTIFFGVAIAIFGTCVGEGVGVGVGVTSELDVPERTTRIVGLE